MQIVKKLLAKLKEYKAEPIKVTPNTNLVSNSFAISMVEGWRGEIVHMAVTGANGELLRYKMKDP